MMLLRIGLLISALWILPSYALAAVPIFDAAATDNTGTTATSHDHTVAADANLLLIFVSQLDTAPAAVVGVTVEGSAATLITGCAKTQGVVRTEIWYYLNPPTGAGVTVAVDTSGTATDATMTGTMSIKGVDTSNPFGTCSTDGTTDSSVDINNITTTLNDLVVIGVSANSTASCSADATSPVSTERFDANNGGNLGGCGYTENGASPTTDMRVDLSGSLTHAEVAVAVHGSGRRPIAPRFQ